MHAADIRFTLYPVGFIISAVFLAATLAAGCLLPTSHHVLHWRCQTHHVACLMLGDILMAIIQLAGDSLHGGSCKALGESLPITALLIFLFCLRRARFSHRVRERKSTRESGAITVISSFVAGRAVGAGRRGIHGIKSHVRYFYPRY